MERSWTTQLLQKARAGDDTALNLLYERIGTRLLLLIRLRLGPSLSATLEPEDVAQEVLIKACAGISQLTKDSSRSFFSWLAVIAGNTIRDLADYHQQARRDMRQTISGDRISSDLTAKHRSALSRLILDEGFQCLERGLEKLNDRQREVIILRRFEERSFKEIAEIMGGSEDSCRMLYTRALARLTLKVQQTRTSPNTAPRPFALRGRS